MTDLYSHVTGHWQRHGRGEAPRKRQKNEQNGRIKIERKLNHPFTIYGRVLRMRTVVDMYFRSLKEKAEEKRRAARREAGEKSESSSSEDEAEDNKASDTEEIPLNQMTFKKDEGVL